MNSTDKNTFQNAAKKVFSDLYALIKEDEKETENKIDNNKKNKKNVKSNKIDDKNVISNEIKELMDEEQIINGKTIEFGTFINTDIVVPLNTKEDIKEYIFHYINLDFQDIKKYAKKRKVRLSNDDMCKRCFILFKRCKILFDLNKVYYNMDDNEEKDFFMEYLKLKNLSLPQKMTFEY